MFVMFDMTMLAVSSTDKTGCHLNPEGLVDNVGTEDSTEVISGS